MNCPICGELMDPGSECSSHPVCALMENLKNGKITFEEAKKEAEKWDERRDNIRS